MRGKTVPRTVDGGRWEVGGGWAVGKGVSLLSVVVAAAAGWVSLLPLRLWVLALAAMEQERGLTSLHRKHPQGRFAETSVVG